VNRKLIRPNINEVKENNDNKGNFKKKNFPQESTHAEYFYYLKQINNKVPMVIVLNDGEKLHGFIEWYDKNCIKLNRVDEPNLLIFKHSIKYLYKDLEKME